MAEIRAFRGIRPAAGKEADIAALPYDVYNREEARKAVEGKPLTFLRIDRAETQLSEETDIYAPEVYLTNGSHGCVNTPPAAMAQVYANMETGTPVVLYY